MRAPFERPLLRRSADRVRAELGQLEARQVQRPDDGFVDAPDGQAVLLGRLNKIYGTVGGGTLGPAYRGRVGFIAD